jgi:hypothetical protein
MPTHKIAFLIIGVLCTSTFAQSRLGIDHHINLGRNSYNNSTNKIAHIHMMSGAGALMASSMDISSNMKKDFYLLSSITTTLGGAHYLTSIDKDERYIEGNLGGQRDLYKDKEVQKEHYYRTMAEKAKHTRIYSSASLIATGAGYLAYYGKYRNDNSKDAHRASLAALILGAGKVIAGVGHLMNKSYLEKTGEKIFDKESRKVSWNINYRQGAPVLNLAMTF